MGVSCDLLDCIHNYHEYCEADHICLTWCSGFQPDSIALDCDSYEKEEEEE